MNRYALGLAAPFVLAIAALACGEDEVLTPTQTAAPSVSGSPTVDRDQTTPSDWSMYTDAVFGFSFPHPSNLEAKDETPQPPSGQMRTDWPLRVVVFEPVGGRTVMGISVYANAAELTPQEWAKEFTACHFEDPFEVQPVTIDGATGITCMAEPLAALEPSAILSRGDNIFFLSTLLTDSDFVTLLNGFRFQQ